MHRSSITVLRLARLRTAAAAAGLRESFLLVLFAILSTTLKTLVVDNCSQVHRAWPSHCVSAWPLHACRYCGSIASCILRTCILAHLWQPSERGHQLRTDTTQQPACGSRVAAGIAPSAHAPESAGM